MKHPVLVIGGGLLAGAVILYYRYKAKQATAAAVNEAQTNSALTDYLQASGLYGGTGGYAQAGFQALNPADQTASQQPQTVANAAASTVPQTSANTLGGSGALIPMTLCDCVVGYINAGAGAGNCNCVPDPNFPVQATTSTPTISTPTPTQSLVGLVNAPQGVAPSVGVAA